MGTAVAAVAVQVGAVGRTAGLQGALLVCGPREQRYVSGQVKSLTAMAGNDASPVTLQRAGTRSTTESTETGTNTSAGNDEDDFFSKV